MVVWSVCRSVVETRTGRKSESLDVVLTTNAAYNAVLPPRTAAHGFNCTAHHRGLVGHERNFGGRITTASVVERPERTEQQKYAANQ